MKRKILLIVNIVLLVYVLSATNVHGENVQQEVNVQNSNQNEAINQRQKRADGDDDDGGDDGDNDSVTRTTITTTTSVPSNGGSSKYGSKRIPVGSGTYDDNTYDTYDSNTYDSNKYDSNKYDNKYNSYTGKKYSKKTGYKGNKGYKNNYPFQYEEYKVGDSSESEEGVSMAAAIDIWILEANNWESDRGSYYRGKGSSKYKKTKKYNKYENSNKYDDGSYDDYDKYDKYDNNDYSKSRSKRSYTRVKFPVRHFPNIRDFPIKRIPPLISILPWLPIFYDKLTYQTFIFSPTGGMYILPALVNHFGQRFSVAQLIKWGYASLVSSGVPPPPNVNVAPLVQPSPPVTEPGTGGGARSVPSYDTQQHRFTEGVRTDFRSFRPRYPQVIYESGNNYNAPSYNAQRIINSGYNS